MNIQRIPKKMILCIAGVSLLFLGAFPQILWASHGNRLIEGIFSDMGLVFVGQPHGRHHPPPERPHYGGKGRPGCCPPAYRDHRRPGSHWGCRNSGYHRPPSRGHRNSQSNHYHRNRHRHSRVDHHWNRWNW